MAGRVRLEVLSLLRSPGAAFFSIVLPMALVVMLGLLNGDSVVKESGQRFVTYTVPGVLAFGLISMSYGNLAITLVSLRETGVLKRLRSTPMPPAVYVAGQLGAVLVLATVMSVTAALGGWLLFGVSLTPRGAAAFAVAAAVGTACFATLGLALTTVITRSSAASPVAQATYIPLALGSSVFFPSQHQPRWLELGIDLFPVSHFAKALQQPFVAPEGPFAASNLAVLVVWGIAGAAVALRRFRWW